MHHVPGRRLLGYAVVATLLVVAGVVGVRLVLGPPSDPAPAAVAGEPAPPVTDDPLARIAVAGDTGTGDAAERATVAEMVSQADRGGGGYDAVLLLGDLVYEDGDAARVDDAVTEPFAPLLDDGVPLLPVLGNHDYESDEQTQIMAALGRDDAWYEQRVGPVRVLVLDTERTGDAAQTAWLKERLAAPQPAGTWTVVALHRPPYSAGQHGSDPRVRADWVPLFDEYDVPLVLAGHDHDYQRSDVLDGVVYVVSGAGAKLRPTGQAGFTAVSSSTLHYVDLLVYADRLVGRAIDQSGALVDVFTVPR